MPLKFFFFAIVIAAFFAGLFFSGDIFSVSGAGGSWTQATSSANWAARSNFGSVVLNNKMWVMGGIAGSSYFNDVWSSSDGISWTQATSSANWATRSNFGSAIFDNKMWIMGGTSTTAYFNDVWSSSDGISWTQATSSANWISRHSFSSVVFNNKMWIAGGAATSTPSSALSDVWSSSDGISWTQATSAASWGKRYGHTSLVFNNKMWVIGGRSNGGSTKDDAWSSSDGITWTQETVPDVPFHWAVRDFHNSVVFDNKTLVVGGKIAVEAGDNDVWYSSDGINWTQATADANWAARYAFGSVIFNNKMWVIGGATNGTTVKNDVWYALSDIWNP